MGDKLMQNTDRSVVFEVKGEEVKLSPQIVRDYLTSGNAKVTDQEVVMFINLCKFQKLNPFLNEAYLVKFGGKNPKPAQLIVSKEAFMKRAEQNPQYKGFEAGVIVERDGKMLDLEGAIKLPSDKLLGGWARVHREDRDFPVSVRISLEEFSKGQATWKDMPLNMIRKSAIVNAQREAFPDALGALYTEDDVQDFSDREVRDEVEQKANKKTIRMEPEKAIEAEPVKEVVIDEEVEPQMAGQTTIDGPGF